MFVLLDDVLDVKSPSHGCIFYYARINFCEFFDGFQLEEWFALSPMFLGYVGNETKRPNGYLTFVEFR